MNEESCLYAAVLALLYVTVAVGQHPVLDAVANKVVTKYQTSTCQQLMQQQAHKQPPSAAEQKAMEMLKTDPGMRHEFVSIVADQVVDKLIQCGTIPMMEGATVFESSTDGEKRGSCFLLRQG